MTLPELIDTLRRESPRTHATWGALTGIIAELDHARSCSQSLADALEEARLAAPRFVGRDTWMRQLRRIRKMIGPQ